MNEIKIFLFLLLSFTFTIFCYSEEIILKTGKVINGEIVERGKDYIKIKLEGVSLPLTYYLEEIREINTEPTLREDKPYSQEKYSPAQIFKEVSKSVVYIINKDIGGEEYIGSGFIIDTQGAIITNYHVVQGARRLFVKVPRLDQEGERLYEVKKILNYDVYRDICILQIEQDKEFRPLRLGSFKNVSVGDKVYAIGNPLGLEYSFSDGMVSGIRETNNIKYIQFTAPVSPGNSGGPLLNSKGEVIGVVTFLIWGGQNLNFAISIDEVKEVLKGKETTYRTDRVYKEDMNKIAGTYEIVYAHNPYDSTAQYRGKVEIISQGETYKLIWRFPNRYDYYEGIGIIIEDNLCVGWNYPYTDYGVMVYRIKDNRRLEGRWSINKSNIIGTEIIEKIAGDNIDITGKYKIISRSSSYNKNYAGEVYIERYGKVYLLEWDIDSYSSYKGVGIREGDLLIVGWGDYSTGIVYYKIGRKDFKGFWAIQSSSDIGVENLMKIR